MCSTDYDNSPTFWNVSEPIAKKQHKCCECKRTIQAGEKYKRQFGVWDGRAEAFKMCKFCIEPASWLVSECGGYPLGDLKTEIEEHAFEYKKMFLYRWLINIREGWKRKDKR